MLTAIYVIFVVLILFGLTIFVHELGHFLVARWCGLKIEAFSIGFGKSLIQKEVNGVVYKIGVFPFGGYVALPQLDPTLGLREDGAEEKDKLPPVTPGKKIAVAVAGVIMNMIFAYFIALYISYKGMPATPDDVSSVVGFVDEKSEAYENGFRVGDEILSIDGEKIDNWKDFMLLTALKDQGVVTVRTPSGEIKEIEVAAIKDEDANFRRVEGLSGRNLAKVLSTVKGSSAESAGVMPDDLVVELDGIPLLSRGHMISLVTERKGKTIPMVVERGEERLTLMVTPEYDEEENRPLIGIMFNTFYKDSQFLIYPSPWEQISDSAGLIFRTLKAFVTPGEAKNAASGIGGPLVILYMLFKILVGSGFVAALWLTGLINVNLAIVNMLPLPILDGGHVTFALYEAIFKRPPPPKLVYALSNVFFILLLSVALLLTYRDLFKVIIPIERSSRNAPVEEPVDSNQTSESLEPETNSEE